jgi:O-acetyl-ADP-ribose deacetylase (regulator of RNase III)
MPLRYVHGDLLEAPERVVAHGCNAKGVFALGVAGLVRRRWPEAFASYAEAHAEGRLVLGSVVWARSAVGKVVANCITQPTYGRTGLHVDYEAVRRCMEAIRHECRPGGMAEGERSIAMPLIGAGLGGGDWRTIMGCIEAGLGSLEAVVYLVDGRIPG